jgi:hypothetical protein
MSDEMVRENLAQASNAPLFKNHGNKISINAE